ncbi:MAG: hypothetical protein A3C49_02460 [Candidatus Doudnabacteria bacterium RIFCSPHIGHO2_02_FULL_42_25]|uniref:Histidine kinase n=1 Tax=Candidatus Doudnabacteria bacterium RIFCSPHIGHO2_01_FULL_41_86 TaxID=1817821 RepID=A0A1F5N9R2_9BACT|nr:MAG: hypothetical protein A2717_02055 [Candidatus Doudnabacteria bacterium RIFCSPHIGHO2_01_FULL_41_86]OGE75551.1 MAG: hypothetical protein A3K07_01810 [Candidatus Doudnabacteria bacterium RIFCSPHIGHO2_01_43_10]OGE85347.1 MAG: hypothetical protein A3E28_01625 [Candidatus Doudnabacteria bacterium RIFCSPHIGHO2_12_FULL_42_22]OGE86885.1 MAG: hypothetical protein A3C49_02460 [Candidatus Doudnabacteria bacterium RIFCSPHIGHO2_02_FULL_42_25]OGE92484.1 MAG: hypothetical protein A2895_02615 [Candidatus
MKIEQKRWTKDGGWENLSTQAGINPQLVLAFGERTLIEDPNNFQQIKSFYPSANIIVCSTAGEILGDKVTDNSIVVSAIEFEKTQLQFQQAVIGQADDSKKVGNQLAETLPKEGLVHAMVFSDGLKVNGTALVNGLNEKLPPTVSVTGGLVGDGANFKKTSLGLNEPGQEGKVILVGFYGTNLKIGYGSLGGWDAFGVERVITKAKNNILYELDGQPALKLYKEYLGDQAAGLPSTGLLFPLRLRLNDGKQTEVVRTILAVDEKEQSMTFAGDMPEGTPAALMKANFERLIDGASGAGNMSVEQLGKQEPELAVLISCVGRKLVLKERIDEEIEAVRTAIGKNSAITGFYSYGELCPTAATEKQCQLHNQTMTITTFREV